MRVNLKNRIAEIVREWKWKDAEKILSKSKDPELREIGRYIRENGHVVMPYYFSQTYDKLKIITGTDKDGYPFVMDCGRKLYGRKRTSEESFREYYRILLKEQDKSSAHCYITGEERLPDASNTLFDCGAAEGFFALRYIDIVKRVVLFECNEEWIEPLRRTFAPYQNKVQIVQSYVGSTDLDGQVSIDKFTKTHGYDHLYIKADIEGAERDLLLGAEKASGYIDKMLLCSYHWRNDADWIASKMDEMGFQVDINPHYMFFTEHIRDFKRPYVRRGIIYGHK